MNEVIHPIGIDGDSIEVYHEGKVVKFDASDVSRIDVTKGAEKGVVVTFIVEGFIYDVSLSKIGYQWGLKNELYKKFNRVLFDTTL